MSENKIQVNGIFTDFSKSLLSLATNKGFQIYSINSLIKLSDSSNEKLGELKIAIPFYLSSIILIVGKFSDSIVTNYQFILYDDKIKNQICIISFKEKIFSAKIIIEGIFISFSNKIKVFDIKTLNNVFDINDTYESRINLFFNNSNLYLSEISFSNRNVLKIYEMNYTKNDGLKLLHSSEISVPCNKLYKITNDKKGNKICCVSKDDNNIFIYNVNDQKLLCSFKIVNSFLKIQNLEFNKDFICIFYINNLIEIYNLNNNNNINNDILEIFAKYKFNYSYLDELIDEKYRTNNNNFIINFTQKSEFSLIDSHGIYQKIKFDTNNKEKIWCVREINFLNNL
jgi:hypothetical protein